MKGRWTRFGGSIQVNPGDLAATRGKVSMELGDLKTHTFGEPGKDSRQTSHALNWMEVGPEVSATTRQRHGTATLVIEAIEGASPPKLADGQLKVRAKVTGTLTLHGVKAKKTVPVEVTFQGPADAPTAVAIRSASPMRISLKQHDIKPRDLAGRFLAGALDKIGQKIADTAQVTINLKGKAPRADPRLP
ncbi:MAG: YceI family protein [Myxococcales bacterium]|nr:YceI family protein [Myxococcales bacterium]